MFADLCGFTTLCERLDPEDVRTLQNELFEEMSAAVRDFGGYIERFVGDSLLALFGAPTAHEDDPERALRAGLDMLARTARLGEQWEPRTGAPLALHIGINTGPAVVGAVGTGSARAYSVTGDTANTGARLQAAADDGEIVVGPLTHRLTQHAFSFEPMGELRLKGKAEPLAAYKLIGVRDIPHARRGLESLGLVAPMIGRDDELSQMITAFHGMLHGRAQVVRLVGDAGVGKTRLLKSFFECLELDGKLDDVAVRRATCSSLGDQPYAFLATVLRDVYGITADAPLEEARRKLDEGLQKIEADEVTIRQITPLLGYVLGIETDGLHHVSPEQLKRQIFFAVRILFETRLRHSPMLLVVEDLQWVDAASLELLGFLSERLHDRAFMLILSHRPEFEGGSRNQSRTTQHVMRLEPLSAESTEKMLDALFGESTPHIPELTRKLIVDRSGGIPLYVEEIARGLIENGILVQHEHGWSFSGDTSGLDIPQTIQGQLLARVDRLPPGARHLVQEASVLGSKFDEDELRAIASEADELESNLELLCQCEILQEILDAPAGDSGARVKLQYRFGQTMLQEAVYQNLLMRRRSELHLLAGESLEKAGSGKPLRLEDLEALGHHFSLSPEKIKGARYLVAAGDWARDIFANQDAARHYRRALACVEDAGTDAAQALAICERLGDLLGPAGQMEEALSHYEAALEGFTAAADKPAQARCLRKIAVLHWETGNRERAWSRCREGFALLEDWGRHIELAYLCQEMGRFAFREGDNRQAAEWAGKALEQVESLAAQPPDDDSVDPEQWKRQIATVMSHSNDTLGVALARMGELGKAVEHVRRSVAVAETNGLLHAACRGYTNLGVLHCRMNPADAIETSLKGLAIADRIGDLGFQSRLNANLAAAYCTFTGRCEVDGIAAAQKSVDLDRALGLRDHLAVPLLVLGQIYHCHGEPQRAAGYYEEAMKIAEESQEPQLLFPCYDGMAMLSLDLGDDVRAEEYMQKAQSVCEQAALDPDELTILPFLF